MRLEREVFKLDLEAVTFPNGGITAKTKDRLFELAWEYGHSEGLLSVASYYDELAELVR
jgi:hypothetical protein